MASFRIILPNSDIQIRRILNKAAVRKFSSIFFDPSLLKEIQNVVKMYVRTAIQKTVTWQSLMAGGPEGLDAHFGIPRGTLHKRLSVILDTWSDEIIVKPGKVKFRPRTFSINYEIFAIYGDWHNVLGLEEGITTNISSNPEFNGKKLPWLQWLLISGDQVEIEKYHIVFGNKPKSRSGKAVMVKKLNWRVPTSVPGGDIAPFNTNDNFVTRAMDELAGDSAFRKELAGIIQGVPLKSPSVDLSAFEKLLE